MVLECGVVFDFHQQASYRKCNSIRIAIIQSRNHEHNAIPEKHLKINDLDYLISDFLE
jgi:hypothetical protein